MPSPRNRLSSSGPATTARSSHFGLFGALLLHGGVVAATSFSWPHTLDIQTENVPVVPVELVTIADITNIAAQSPEPPPPEPQEIVPVQEAPPPPPEPEVAEVAPDAPPSPQVAEKAPPPAAPKAKPAPPPPKQESFDINNIMALLDKQTPPTPAPNARLAEQNVRGAGAQNAMTMDLQAALKNQIAQCWNPPVGAPRAEDLIVEFVLFLNPDGSVARPPQLIANANSGSSYSRASAEAARRAIYGCAPYQLPANRYNLWSEINFIFDPRQMMGQ